MLWDVPRESGSGLEEYEEPYWACRERHEGSYGIEVAALASTRRVIS